MPVSLLVMQKMAALLQNGGALQTRVVQLAQQTGLALPVITPAQVVLSSANPELADNNVELTYPRVCLYASGIKNTLLERFRSFSGTVNAVAQVWASSTSLTDCDQWIHYYLEAVSSTLTQSRGDWGDGVYFSGMYDVQIQTPKAGGFGFVQSAQLVCQINVSQN